jgi:large subunit ribosomal protein L24
MTKLNIKKGDKVKVIAGNSRGKISTVVSVSPKESKIIVEGINMVTKHLKPTSSSPSGSIIKKEAPMHISNVMLVDATSGLPTRIGRKEGKDGKTERVSIKSGLSI